MLAVAEAGGDDYEDAEDEWIVYTSPTDLMAVKKRSRSRRRHERRNDHGAHYARDGERVRCEEGHAPCRPPRRAGRLQNVYHVMDITDEIAEALDE